MHLCTYSEKELFYSWRRDGEKTGRFGLLAMLT
jgi:copper oxidase (laccase) domain-containing protein